MNIIQSNNGSFERRRDTKRRAQFTGIFESAARGKVRRRRMLGQRRGIRRIRPVKRYAPSLSHCLSLSDVSSEKRRSIMNDESRRSGADSALPPRFIRFFAPFSLNKKDACGAGWCPATSARLAFSLATQIEIDSALHSGRDFTLPPYRVSQRNAISRA